jgi:hypothetical protein
LGSAGVDEAGVDETWVDDAVVEDVEGAGAAEVDELDVELLLPQPATSPPLRTATAKSERSFPVIGPSLQMGGHSQHSLGSS